jgi:hypothetical protein
LGGTPMKKKKEGYIKINKKTTLYPRVYPIRGP